jgi:hypothetical protein
MISRDMQWQFESILKFQWYFGLDTGLANKALFLAFATAY